MSNDLVAGVVGLGFIGGGIVGRMQRAGRAVVVHDIRPEAAARFPGATAAADPAAVAADADVVVVAVVDEAQVRSVFYGPRGLLAAGKRGLSVVIVSTITISCLEEVAAKAAEAGVAVIDCGVAGTQGRGAAADQMICMVGGSDADVARVRPVLESFSFLVAHLGKLGAGMETKIARNLLTYGVFMAVAEAMRLIDAAGIDREQFAQIVRTMDDHQLGGYPSAAMGLGGGADPRERKASPIVHKDLHAAEEMADSYGVDTAFIKMAEARADAMFQSGVQETPPVPLPTRP